MFRAIFVLVVVADAAKLPHMGWMSWEVFRCNIDCATEPANCIGERLYEETAVAMAAGGYVDAGYSTVSIDDCWEATDRDETTGRLRMDPDRFPSGPIALNASLGANRVKFGIYSDAGTNTCAGYPGSKGAEAIDAATFASWGVSYLKYDGCNDPLSAYPVDYPTMGAALKGQHDITFSCSWPAYLGDDETQKPFDAMRDAGCDLWRNWDDIQCSWASLASIIDHFGNYSDTLQDAGPGHDPDMLLVGNDCVTDDEAETQFAVWSVLAAPLIMGNDLRNVSESARAILLNDEAIAVDQDENVVPGVRLSAYGAEAELWRRDLANGDVAAALINRDDTKVANLTLNFADLGLVGQYDAVAVRDIFKRADRGVFVVDNGEEHDQGTTEKDNSGPSFTVPPHGVAFLRLSPAPMPARVAAAGEEGLLLDADLVVAVA